MGGQSKSRILVAEDSSTIAHVLRFSLERAGFEVTVASDGLEALQEARRDEFDLVLADEQMPRMSGRELCQQLRNDPRYTETPLIFVTGKRLEIESDIVRSFGPATEVIGKPFSPKSLVERVEATLGLVEA